MTESKRTREITIVETKRATDSVVKSAARVLAVLSVFDDFRREMRVGEICDVLGFPQSSTSMLLRSLVKLGYLNFDPRNRAFSVTARVALLGSWVGDGAIANGTVVQEMEVLGRETGHTITLAARNGIFVQYIHVVQATNALRLHTPVGTRRLLVWSASGFALLRDTPDSEIAALVRRTNSEQANEKHNVVDVICKVKSFREKGYFFSKELVTPGGGHIAMRLPSSSIGREHTLALGVSGWIEQIARDQTKIVKLMERSLRNIELGSRPSS